MDAILYWNKVALDVTKTDFSTDDPAVNPTPQQGGPTRTSRALAIVHLAMYDAFVGVQGGPKYLTYSASEVPAVTNDLHTAQIAVATAAALTMIALFDRQKDEIWKEHGKFLAELKSSSTQMSNGINWGSLVAGKMLASRVGDGSDASNNAYTPSMAAGAHRPDPTSPAQGFLGPLWGNVKPFGIDKLNTKVPGVPPPPLNSPAYAKDYNAVMDKGRDQGGSRTPEETTIGLFWAYDGPRNIGVPPRLYNQVVRAISEKKGVSEADNAKLFAMVNVAMADAGIQAWAEKYKYNIWRPVLGIREADAGWGPTGQGDGNNKTSGDPYWTPLGAPHTNQPKAPFTPSFPAYPSGHATFGTAAIRVAANMLCLPDNFEFNLVSEELNGESVGATGVRARNDRKLTIKSAIEENIISRVYLGVHWEFDGREGEKNGTAIAEMINKKFPALA
jgi:Vanadium chloroperoxidase N-terminal domain/PAP2 superfamily